MVELTYPSTPLPHKLILDLNPGAPGVSETYGRRERQRSRARFTASLCNTLLAIPLSRQPVDEPE